VYDGDGGRLQQIDHTGEDPLTTTYTNDIVGLSQVLVSNDGITTTYNLFGLDLISQDDGTQTRILLTDGLGNTRLEMVGQTIETTTTYEPYGKLLAQTGSSGTVYGFTGEQHDALTSLVYLRARYYNPSLKLFMSRDPFPGIPTMPASQHGHSYSHNDPVNYFDPTGMWRWRGSGNIYHDLVEFYYEGVWGGSPVKQLEFTIPGGGGRVDMFNAHTGDVFEVEPIILAFLPGHGVHQTVRYVNSLNNAANNDRLRGYYLGTYYYDWNGTSFHPGTSLDWPNKLRMTLPGFPLVDFVADYVLPGLVVYWLEPKVGVTLEEARENSPNRQLVRNRGFQPSLGLPNGAPTHKPGLVFPTLPTAVELVSFEAHVDGPFGNLCRRIWRWFDGGN
jgi:RHS repeat-associated protein